MKGVVNGVPENTIAAFRTAVELGVDACEMDVLLSADGEAFVQYPGVVDSFSPGNKPMSKLSAREIREIDLFKKHPGAQGIPGAGRIPSLEDAFDLFRDHSCLIVVDVFEIQAVPLVLESIRKYSFEKRVIATAPTPDVVSEFKKRDPSLCVGLLVAEGSCLRLQQITAENILITGEITNIGYKD